MNRTSQSYMEMCFHVDGGENLYLRVPTLWDDTTKMWRGFIKTPETQRLIHGEGKTSFDLQNSFNAALKEAIESDIADEVMGMFMPKWFWESA